MYQWVGDLVVLAYTAGSPDLDNVEEPFYEIARGHVESREGVFALAEASSLGIVVRKLRWSEDRQSEELAQPVFMPWGAITSLYRLPDEDDAAEEQET